MRGESLGIAHLDDIENEVECLSANEPDHRSDGDAEYEVLQKIEVKKQEIFTMKMQIQ